MAETIFFSSQRLINLIGLIYKLKILPPMPPSTLGLCSFPGFYPHLISDFQFKNSCSLPDFPYFILILTFTPKIFTVGHFKNLPILRFLNIPSHGTILWIHLQTLLKTLPHSLDLPLSLQLVSLPKIDQFSILSYSCYQAPQQIA